MKINKETLTELNSLYIKEYTKEKQSGKIIKYSFTKSDLILFCINLIKTIINSENK